MTLIYRGLGLTTLLILSFAAAGCKSKPPKTLPPEPETVGFASSSGTSAAPQPTPLFQPKIAPPAVVGGVERAVVARSYLTVGEAFVPGPGELPNAIVLLSSPADPLNQATCEAFVKGLKPAPLVVKEDPTANVIDTYWPINSFIYSIDDCSEILKFYDFKRAAKARSDYGLNEVSGPALLFVQADKRYVALDLSAGNSAQVSAIFQNYFSLMVDEGVGTSPAPTSPKLSIIKPKLVVATASSPASTKAAEIADGSTKPGNKVGVRDVLCVVAKGVGIFVTWIGNIGDTACKASQA